MIESLDYNIQKHILAVIVNALIFSFETIKKYNFLDFLS